MPFEFEERTAPIDDWEHAYVRQQAALAAINAELQKTVGLLARTKRENAALRACLKALLETQEND